MSFTARPSGLDRIDSLTLPAMPTKEFSAQRLDVQAFAEEGARLSGQRPLSAFERIAAEAEGRGGDRLVTWQASGELRNPRHVHPEVWVTLQVDAVLPLTCQRCLAPVDVPVSIDRAFRFVADEAQAAAQDDASEEDLLALSRSFDLFELLEDEVLMDLPLVPRHETCPEPLPVPAAEPAQEVESPRPNPFAVLQGLKSGGADKGSKGGRGGSKG